MAAEVEDATPAGQWTQEQFSDTYWKARRANGGEHLSEESMAWLLKKRGLPSMPFFQQFMDEGKFDKLTAGDAFNQRGDQYVPFLGAGIAGYETWDLLQSAKAMERGDATPEQEKAVWAYQVDMVRPKSGWYKFWDLVTDLPAPALEFAAGGAGAGRLLSTGIKEAAEMQAKTTIGRKLADFGIRAAISGSVRVPGEAAQRAFNAAGVTVDESQQDALELQFAAKTGEVLDYLPEGVVSQLWETASEMSGAVFANRVAKADVFAHLVRFIQVKTFGAAAAKHGTDKAWNMLNKLGYQGGGLSEALEEVIGGLGRAASDLVPGLDMDETVRGAFPETFEDAFIQYMAFSVPGAAGTTVDLATMSPQERMRAAEQAAAEGTEAPENADAAPGGDPSPAGQMPTREWQAPSQETLQYAEDFAPGGKVVEPTPEMQEAARAAEEMGTSVVFVEPGEAGAKGQGASYQPGTIFVDATQATPRTIIAHEIVHDLSRASSLEFQGILRKVQKAAPDEFREWRRAYQGRGGTAVGDALSEEALADYAASLPDLIEHLATPDGFRMARRIALRQRTLWEKIVDAVRRVVGGVKAVDAGQQARILADLDSLKRATGREITKGDVDVASILWSSMNWVAESRAQGSPKVVQAGSITGPLPVHSPDGLASDGIRSDPTGPEGTPLMDPDAGVSSGTRVDVQGGAQFPDEGGSILDPPRLSPQEPTPDGQDPADPRPEIPEKQDTPPGAAGGASNLIPPAPYAGAKAPDAEQVDEVRRHFALGSQPRERRANISGDASTREVMDAIDVTRNDAGQPYRDSVKDWYTQAEKLIASEPRDALLKRLTGATESGQLLDAHETIALRSLTADAVQGALASGSAADWSQAVRAGIAYRESGAEWGRAGVARREEFTWAKTSREELSDVISQPTYRQRRYFNRLKRKRAELRKQEQGSEALKRVASLNREINSIEAQIAQIEAEFEALLLDLTGQGQEPGARLSPKEGEEGQPASKPTNDERIAEDRAAKDAQIAGLNQRLAKLRSDLKSVRLNGAEKTVLARVKEVDAQLEKEIEKDAGRMVQAVKQLHKEGIDPEMVIREDLTDPATRRRIAQVTTEARSDGWDWFLAWRYNSMLSWAGTHARNIGGNTLNTAMEQGLQRAAEGIIASTLRKTTGKGFGESPFLDEFKVMAPVIWRSLREAARVGWAGYTTGMPTMEMDLQRQGVPIEGTSSKIEHAAATRQDSKKLLFLDYLGTRALQGADDFAKTFIYLIEVEARALRAARAEGLTGQELMDRRTEILQDPTHKTKQESYEAAKKTAFQSDPGRVAQFITNGRSMLDEQLGMPVGTMLLPFVQTPIQIFKAGMRKVPPITMFKMVAKGIATKRGKDWGYETEDAQLVTDAADLLIGSAMFWGVSALLMGDDDDDRPAITGSRERWGSKADLQYRTFPPLSFRIGDQWYSYAGLEPLATFLAPSVDAVDAWWIAAQGGDAEQIAAASSAIGNSVLASVQDKTFLATMGELYQLITSPEYTSSAQFVRDTLVTPMVPNVIRGATRESDQYLRLNTFKPDGESTPWGMLLSFDLRAWGPVLPAPNAPWTPPPKRDVWGRPIERSTQLEKSSLWVLPHLIREAAPLSQRSAIEKADLAMRAWNRKVLRGEAGDDAEMYYPSTPRVSKTWTPEEVDRLVLEAGTMAGNRVRGIPFSVDDPSANDIRLIKRAISRSYDTVRNRIRKERRATQ